MGAAKRLDGTYPDKQYLDKGEREGWVNVQEISMKRIIVDPAYQARDIPTKSLTGIAIDMNHVKKLAGIRDLNNGEFLGPIVVFVTPDGRFLLADGYHRYEENRQRRGLSIRAYVVKSNDHEHEARLFAAMCNRELCLPRSLEDIKKAAVILFADPICWEWSHQRIADHCGTSSSTMKKWMNEYSIINNKKITDVYKMENGNKRKRRRLINGKPSVCRTGNKGFKTTIKGVAIYLGRDKEIAERKLDEIKNYEKDHKFNISQSINIVNLLTIRGIMSQCIKINCGSYGLSSAYKALSCVYTGLDSGSPAKFSEIIGTLRLARIHAEMLDARMVVICYVDDLPAILVELAKKDGVEFLTPDEFAENLKRTEPQESQEEPKS